MNPEPLPTGGATWALHDDLLSAPPPTTLSLEVTNHCNLRCSHCGHSQYPTFEKGHLDPVLFDRVGAHLGAGGIGTLNLSDYGEPLLSRHWWTLYDRARAIPGLALTLITNAVLLDRHMDRLAHPGLQLTVSIDGASEATYGHFRGPGHFGQVVANLRSWRERERAGVYPDTTRAFIVVLSRVNVHEMADIVTLAAELGVGLVVFSFQVFFERARFARESLFYARDAYDQGLIAARARAAELGVALVHPDGFDPAAPKAEPAWRRPYLWRDEQGRRQCGVIRANAYIKFHGQVEACCLPDRYPVGDLGRDAWPDIWHGPHYRRLRQAFATGEHTPRCHNCNIVQSLDVHAEQAHRLTPLRDGGELHPLPQGYRITEMDPCYRDAVTRLRHAGAPEAALTELLRLETIDDRLYEVVNAIAVAWVALGEPDRARALFTRAARLAPDDPLIAGNRRLVEWSPPRSRPRVARWRAWWPRSER